MTQGHVSRRPHDALQPINALTSGSRLQEFELRGTLGEGGFGIVYHGFDTLLEREVAIKEYLPVSHAVRGNDGRVVPRSERQRSAFVKGLKCFLAEARTLARFKHIALVEVLRFWEENGTAYMVMPYYRGRTLGHLIQSGFRIDSDQHLLDFLSPIIGGLEVLHTAGCHHRDVSSDNILVLENGQPVLLDFGASRSMLVSESELSTVILKPGFAPIEQYSNDRDAVPQGPWTDIYALSAVVYQAITGNMPSMSVARIVRDPLVPLTTIGPAGFSKPVLDAIDQGLRVHAHERPQTIQAFETLLRERTTSGHSAQEADAQPHETPESMAVQHTPEPATSPGGFERRPKRSVIAERPAVAPPKADPDGEVGVGVTPGALELGWVRLAVLGVSAVLAVMALWVFLMPASISTGAMATRDTRVNDEIMRQPTTERLGADETGVVEAHQDADKHPAFADPMLARGETIVTQDWLESFTARSEIDAYSEPLSELPVPDLWSQAASPEDELFGFEVDAAVITSEAQHPRSTGFSGKPLQGAAQETAAEHSPVGVGAQVASEGGVVVAGAADTTHGEIEIIVRPWGNVLLNGELVGVAPPSVKLRTPIGPASIEILNETHPPHRIDLQIESGRRHKVKHVFVNE